MLRDAGVGVLAVRDGGLFGERLAGFVRREATGPQRLRDGAMRIVTCG